MFEQKMLFYKFFSSFKIMGAIKGVNISASKQNIKNLLDNFGALDVGIMYANFQASSFIDVGREWSDRQKEEQTTILASIHTGICFAREGQHLFF